MNLKAKLPKIVYLPTSMIYYPRSSRCNYVDRVMRMTMDETSTQISFQHVCEMVRSKDHGSELIDSLDVVSGAILALSPVALGAPGIAGLALIGAKNELVKAGKRAMKCLTASGATDVLTRHEVMAAAYCLICYTSFFEAIDRSLHQVKKQLGLTDSEKLILTVDAIERLSANGKIASSQNESLVIENRGFLPYVVQLPHPAKALEEDAHKLDGLYKEMAAGLQRFIEGLDVWDSASEHQRDEIRTTIRALPVKAKQMYVGQYLQLCHQYNEFFIWTSLTSQALERQSMEKVSADVRTILSLAASAAEEIDLGLKKVHVALEGFTDGGQAIDGSETVLKGLGYAYRASIEEPIIDDSYSQSDGEIQLVYPRKCDIFVPQAFRVIRCGKQRVKLEDETSWTGIDVEQGIGPFILKYFSSPYSVDAPLVVLGQPGSGKSLLTQVLAARLVCPTYEPVRVPLRDINPDSNIQTQIEEQIRNDTGYDVNWANLSGKLTGKPPVVILDGYDELLQASGRVFSTYLMEVASFQRREKAQGRPVRIIVTSRITLIDKAEIPQGSTILRLEDFDIDRQQRWSDIWNAANENYFTAQSVLPFKIPKQDNLTQLAQQPLLLLMLALYDSAGNRLAKDGSIEQTALYYSLLYRFVQREREKGAAGSTFRALPDDERRALIEDDLQRLGTAAIGMYNRKALHILEADLESDIEYFDLRRTSANLGGAKLGQAELLLGSFFFVHESKSRLSSGTNRRASSASAFEFLHNTFGEFLTADFILQSLLEETASLGELQGSSRLQALANQRLDDTNGLGDRWFACLMFTALHTRPVILGMLREWAPHRLSLAGQSTANFISFLDTIIYSQLRRILITQDLPDVLSGRRVTPFPAPSLLEGIGVYTLNLVILRTILGGKWDIHLSSFGDDSGLNPWDRITHLWRAALGTEGLIGLSPVLRSTRTENGVCIESLTKLGAPSTRDSLVQTFAVASAIGDSLLAALSGWALQDSGEQEIVTLEHVGEFQAVQDSPFGSEINSRALLHKRARFGIESVDESVILTGAVTSSSFRLKAYNVSSASSNYSRVLRKEDRLFDSAHPGSYISDLLPWERTIPDFPEGGELLRGYVAALPTKSVAMCVEVLRWHRVAGGLSSLEIHRARAIAQPLVQHVRELIDGGEYVPVEVLIEMMLIEPGYESLLAMPILGPSCNLWALATNTTETVRLMLEVSQRTGIYDWIAQALQIMSTVGLGAQLVQAAGMLNSFRIAHCGLQHVPKTSYDRVNLSGMVSWALANLPEDGRIETLEACASLVVLEPSLLSRHGDMETPSLSLLQRFGIRDEATAKDQLPLSTLQNLHKIDIVYSRRRNSPSARGRVSRASTARKRGS